MQGKYILFALVVILLVCSPVAAITTEIAEGAPVFIGESNLVITSAIEDCHIIAWWPDERNMTGPAAKNLTVKRLNEGNDLSTHFNVSPQVFEGYTGNWYCEDRIPTFVVLSVIEPRLSIRVWDIDDGTDITGQSVPLSANITYRIDTNLDQAMSYDNRTDLTPADGIFTVRLTNPSGKQITNIYTGSVGKADTQILLFDGKPFITTPTYLGRNLESWNRLSHDPSGDFLYPAGTYTFTVSQNLNHMQESYESAGVSDLSGKTTSSASITFLPRDSLTPTSTTQQDTITTIPETDQPTMTIPTETLPESVIPTTVPVAKKTTFSPLPAWIVVTGLLIALICVTRSR